MASFEQHINAAVVVSGVTIAPLYASSLVDMNQSLALLALGMIGGVLPDLDSDNSKPVQISFKILSVFLPLLVILTVLETFTLTKVLFIWAIAFVVLNYGVFKLFLSLSVHRGIFHSIPMGLLIALVSIYTMQVLLEYSASFSVLSGFFLFLGFVVHLLLDELVSLNALGLHIKKSFGTAFKFYDRDNIVGSVVVYVCIVALLFFIPLQSDIFIEIYKSLGNMKL